MRSVNTTLFILKKKQAREFTLPFVCVCVCERERERERICLPSNSFELFNLYET
jgi:hypothetical protein